MSYFQELFPGLLELRSPSHADDRWRLLARAIHHPDWRRLKDVAAGDPRRLKLFCFLHVMRTGLPDGQACPVEEEGLPDVVVAEPYLESWEEMALVLMHFKLQKMEALELKVRAEIRNCSLFLFNFKIFFLENLFCRKVVHHVILIEVGYVKCTSSALYDFPLQSSGTIL